MPDTPPPYAPFAGVALFPRSRVDLTSTEHCPACFHRLARVVCDNCGLDLDHPVAAELADVSNLAAARLDERTELIGRIRFDGETERARIADAARLDARRSAAEADRAPAAASATGSAAFPPPAGAPVPSAPAAPSVPPGIPAAPAAPPADRHRRPTVQIALLIVGISLLSIAAVFFLVYAFINYGIVWRSVIIASITVAAFVTATLLRRRSLPGTAEGIGAFAVVLLYLDAFAVRANDLFGAAATDGLVYWGATLVISSFALVGWHRASRLRVGNVAAFVVFAPGVGLLVAGIGDGLEPASRVFAAFLAVGLAGLVHPLAAHRPTDAAAAAAPAAERLTALGFAGFGLGVAAVAAFAVAPDDDAGISTALALVAAAAVAHAAVAVRTAAGSPVVTAFAAAFSALGAGTGAVAVPILAYRTIDIEVGLGVALVTTTLIALALVWLALRTGPPLHAPAARTAARAAAAAASVVAGIALVIPAWITLYTALPVPVVALTRAYWSLDPAGAVTDPVPAAYGSALGIAVALALVGVFVAVTRRLRRLRATLGWAAATLLLLAAPLLATLWAVLAAWFALAVLALAATRLPRVAGSALSHRLPLFYLAGGATLLGYCTAWASESTWAAGVLATVVLLVAARWLRLPYGVAVRAALLGLAAAVTLGGAAAAARDFGPPRGDASWQALVVAAVAACLVALAAVSSARVFSTADRHTLFAVGGPATLVAVPLAGGGFGDAPHPGLLAGLGALVLASLAAWLLPRAATRLQPERSIAAAALAPALAFTLSALFGLAQLGEATRLEPEAASLVMPVSALVVAAVALAAVARRRAAGRTALDAGVALVAVPGIGAALVAGGAFAWLALLLGAVTALLLAIDTDGLVGSASWRKHLGWLALALATASLWWRLAETRVVVVEAYVLPLAGALLLVALLVWRGGGSRVAPPLVFAALAVAVVPVAVAGVTDVAAGDGALRAVVVSVAAAALLLGGSLARPSAAVRPYLDAAAAAGFAGLVAASAGRAIVDARSYGRHDDATVDLWIAAAAVALVVAGFGQASKRAGDRPATEPVGRALVVSGVLLVGLVETALIRPDSFGTVRAVATVAVLSALYLLCVARDRLPLDRVTGWIAIGAAGLVAVTAIATDAVDAVELVSAPIAVAAVAAGALALVRDPVVRSWAVLGVPLAVLFLPSLFATTVDRPVWRLVAIGVVAVAAIVVGAVRRLQAPFLVGVVVALVHGVATFAPQLRSVYQVTEWWVWLGIGGVVVTVLSLRYERSLRAAKNVVVTIGSLR